MSSGMPLTLPSMIQLSLPEGKKVYFASDFHLGAPNKAASRQREKKIVRWLEHVSQDASHIFLVGDIFDFWYEYAQVVPKGFIRFQGKLAELIDKGIEITFFTGNHDMWMSGYFTEELGIPIYRRPQELYINDLSIHLAHGDGLGPGDHTYKMLKVLFESRVLRWCFSRLHPNFSLWFGHKWSVSNKVKHGLKEEFQSIEHEWLWHYCEEQEAQQHRNYYLFGHRHLVLDIPVKGGKSRYLNLGEWFEACTYAVCDGNTVELRAFENDLTIANQ